MFLLLIINRTFLQCKKKFGSKWNKKVSAKNNFLIALNDILYKPTMTFKLMFY